MSLDPFVGEIQIMAFNFAPRGWAQCNGQLLGIANNQALFALLGTQYGGNGTTTFGLPDLRGRVPVHVGGPSNFFQGAAGGEQQHTLTVNEMPQHTHLLSANATTEAIDNVATPVAGHALGQSIGFASNATFPVNIYASALSSPTAMAPGMIANAGGSQGHENRQPFIALNICIAIQGVFPSRN